MEGTRMSSNGWTMMRHAVPGVLAAAFAIGSIAGLAGEAAAKKKEKAPPPAAAADKDKPYADWKKVTKDAEARPASSRSTRSATTSTSRSGRTSSASRCSAIFSLAQRHRLATSCSAACRWNDRLHASSSARATASWWSRRTRASRARPAAPIEKARDLSFGNSVIASLKIESDATTRARRCWSTSRRSWSATSATWREGLRQRVQQAGALRQGALGARHASRRSRRTSRSRRCSPTSPNDRSNLSLRHRAGRPLHPARRCTTRSRSCPTSR